MKFTLSTIIHTTAENLFNAWLSSYRHSAMTGGRAKCSKKTGGTFSAWNGYITGENLELKPYQYIKQSWRTSEFEEGQPDSIVEIELKQITPGTCQLALTHSELGPKDGQYEHGWIDNYFEPMQRYFKPANESH